jgi:hypothetical protein
MKQLNIKVKLNNNVFFKIVSFPLKHYSAIIFSPTVAAPPNAGNPFNPANSSL